MVFESMTLREFLGQMAAKTPTPGGGAAASAVGALAAALAQMVVAYSVGKKALAAHEPALLEATEYLTRARGLLLALADEDAAAYGAVNELSRLPEGDPRRREELPAAQAAAVGVPMATMAAGLDLLRRFEPLAAMTNRHLRSDLAIAAILAQACCESSRWNVRVNVGSLGDEQQAAASTQAAGMEAAACELRSRIEAACA